MSAVQLEIVAPTHNTSFVDQPTVTFRGAVTDMPDELVGLTLHYRWYSSLFPGDKDRYSMNEPALTNPESPFSDQLGLGTHTITFAVTDQAGETEADLEAVQHGGVTGGSEGDTACIIHVFRANLITPTEGTAVTILEAEAPALWGKPSEDDPNIFDLNEDYHALNRLQYRWEFVPVGEPTNRSLVNVTPDPAEYEFDPEPATATVPVIRFVAADLPAQLTGTYNLTLHVEDKDGEFPGHQMSVNNVEVT